MRIKKNLGKDGFFRKTRLNKINVCLFFLHCGPRKWVFYLHFGTEGVWYKINFF